ncbi:MAG: 4-hydroxythreonine-4-phosphate dehydrogenase PdxA [Gammaproteobacteria bacterium]|nr:4-hydroxythreonine-4-phosphate dehydrogenase PdxA [Gammaproteobacteria bacterium]
MLNHKASLPVIALSVGEPAGIGPDIAIKLAQHNLPCCLIAIGNSNLLLERATILGLSLHIIPYLSPPPEHQPGTLIVYDLPLATPVIPGQLNKANAQYVLKSISIATELCLEGVADAMVTGPVHKGLINEAGIAFSGHTEFIATLCHVKDVVMMLASKQLKVALTTVHMPLSQVPKNITEPRLTNTLRILNRALIQDFGIATPHIGVCGLNPHAGENGHLGSEENTIIIPALHKLKAEGLNLTGPLPADTLFAPEKSKQFDAIVAMYHDQGLAPLKALYFGQIVNISLGLPIIRTSVDHGTALDIAGSNAADEASLVLAVEYAISLAQYNKVDDN